MQMVVTIAEPGTRLTR